MPSGVCVPFVRPCLDAGGERTIRLDRRGRHIRHLAHRAWRRLHVQSAPDAGRQVVGQGQRVGPTHGLRHADGPSREILDARIDPKVRARLHNGAVENEAGTGTTRDLGQFRAFDPIERRCSDLSGRIAQPFVAHDFDIWCLRESRDQHRGQALGQPRHVWAGPDDLERHDGHGRSRGRFALVRWQARSPPRRMDHRVAAAMAAARTAAPIHTGGRRHQAVPDSRVGSTGLDIVSELVIDSRSWRKSTTRSRMPW